MVFYLFWISLKLDDQGGSRKYKPTGAEEDAIEINDNEKLSDHRSEQADHVGSSFKFTLSLHRFQDHLKQADRRQNQSILLY